MHATRNIKIDRERQKKPAITSQHHFNNIIVHTKNLIAVREFWMKRKIHSPPMRRKKNLNFHAKMTNINETEILITMTHHLHTVLTPYSKRRCKQNKNFFLIL